MINKISVVIPAFNESKIIGDCINALNNQIYDKSDFEIIVVDGNSSDNTEDIAKNLGAKVFNFTGNGVSGARQFGAKKAKYPIIAFTDADTITAKNWLESINILFQNKNIVCCGGVGMPIKKAFLPETAFYVTHVFYLINQFFGKPLIWGYNFAIRKSALDAIGGFNEHLPSSEDWDVAIRVVKKYGKKSLIYTNKLKAKTSSRKLDNVKVLFKYTRDGIVNYYNIVLLGRMKSTKIDIIR